MNHLDAIGEAMHCRRTACLFYYKELTAALDEWVCGQSEAEASDVDEDVVELAELLFEQRALARHP